ncbi:DNA polymerase III subunit gamma/tau [Candidatus Phytoplasma melaleucae]|uniref:DNA polymerase III subunit gamma/tau n=1 Tax=Candidatus Phytoplasma melaleucae TaxID=2982630 RepID=A0ABT9DDB9_9MOLU|nr:DNA polymerase III subunit gamma/tau ['Melaleuca sp.' phytoplasma]MDO8168045.1 DNA polymerase III subunit gamma/tau ['Melaleuca sp.' phytoplasma]
MPHLALYRKYRPRNFSNIIGQKIIIQTLKNAIEYQKIHHCYLLSGDKGVGKTTLAKNLAKVINCANLQYQDCCNSCHSCLSIEQKVNLDVIEIDGASYNGVGEIRELQNTAKYKPNFLKYKIYIIDEVHVLSYNAFNALLKLLEEPPLNLIFILITSELYKIPKTIISRTQHFHLLNIPEKEIEKKLRNITKEEKISIDNKALNKIAFYSNGSMRDALNLLDKVSSYQNNIIKQEDIETILGIVPEAQIEKLAKCLFNKDTKTIISLLESILAPSIEINLFIDDLIDFFQTCFINCFQSENDFKNVLYEIPHKISTKILYTLLQLKQDIRWCKQKKNLLIINFIQLNQYLINQNFNLQNKQTKTNTKTNLTYGQDKSFSEITITNEQNKNDNLQLDFNHLAKKQNNLANNYDKFHINKKENNFTKRLKQILINPDLTVTETLKKGWPKLENFPQKDLEIAARCLYKSNVLLINQSKELLLSCETLSHYKQLIKINIKNKIKTILNSKTKLIEEYFVILNKDWEQVLKPVYLKFQSTRNKKDVDLSDLDVHFYERNSTLNLETKQSIIIELAKEYFGLEKVKISESKK